MWNWSVYNYFEFKLSRFFDIYSEKVFLSYSSHALSFTKKELFSDAEDIEQLFLEMTDQDGILLDQEAGAPYCNSQVELCASVGNWEDPNDLYIADDGVIRWAVFRVDCIECILKIGFYCTAPDVRGHCGKI